MNMKCISISLKYIGYTASRLFIFYFKLKTEMTEFSFYPLLVCNNCKDNVNVVFVVDFVVKLSAVAEADKHLDSMFSRDLLCIK